MKSHMPAWLGAGSVPDHRTHLWTVVLDWLQVEALPPIHWVACYLFPTIVDSRCVPLEQLKEGSRIKQLPACDICQESILVAWPTGSQLHHGCSPRFQLTLQLGQSSLFSLNIILF